MKKTETTTTNPIAITEANPFEALTAGKMTDAGTRKLDFTPVLIATANQRAIETIKAASDNAELHELANKMMEGDIADLIKLFDATGMSDLVPGDAAALQDCDLDQLKRMLESRRSDRSKAKKKGIRSNISVCRNYIATMYAELMVRQVMGKPFTGLVGAAARDFNIDDIRDDIEAVNRKIKSLQSKKCRLNKTAEFVPSDAAELEQVTDEIKRLSELRPTSAVSTKHVVKSMDIDVLRTALASMNTADLPDEVLELMKKLG